MKYKIYGFIFLGLVFAGVVAAIYWWQSRTVPPAPQANNGEICIQVIQKARNPQTGEVKEFPTPCDVPAGWEKISQDDKAETVFCGGIAGIPCPSTGYVCTPEGNYPDAGTNCKKLPIQSYKNKKYGFELKYPSDWKVVSEKNSEGADMITISKKLGGPNISIFPKGGFDSGFGPKAGSLMTTTLLAGKKAVKIASSGLEFYYFIEPIPNWTACSAESLTNCNRLVISGADENLAKILATFQFSDIANDVPTSDAVFPYNGDESIPRP